MHLPGFQGCFDESAPILDQLCRFEADPIGPFKKRFVLWLAHPL